MCGNYIILLKRHYLIINRKFGGNGSVNLKHGYVEKIIISRKKEK